MERQEAATSTSPLSPFTSTNIGQLREELSISLSAKAYIASKLAESKAAKEDAEKALFLSIKQITSIKEDFENSRTGKEAGDSELAKLKGGKKALDQSFIQLSANFSHLEMELLASHHARAATEAELTEVQNSLNALASQSSIQISDLQQDLSTIQTAAAQSTAEVSRLLEKLSETQSSKSIVEMELIELKVATTSANNLVTQHSTDATKLHQECLATLLLRLPLLLS